MFRFVVVNREPHIGQVTLQSVPLILEISSRSATDSAARRAAPPCSPATGQNAPRSKPHHADIGPPVLRRPAVCHVLPHRTADGIGKRTASAHTRSVCSLVLSETLAARANYSLRGQSSPGCAVQWQGPGAAFRGRGRQVGWDIRGVELRGIGPIPASSVGRPGGQVSRTIHGRDVNCWLELVGERLFAGERDELV